MVLRAIEQKIEALFEGVFGRAFRTHVQPVELARRLAKVMDEDRTVSVSRVYVPNEYTIYLSPSDREQFESYEGQLLSELAEYLAEHSRREDYALLTAPRVLMETDADLDVGEYGVATRMVQPDGRARDEGEPAGQLEPGGTMIYRAPQPSTQAVATGELGVLAETVILQWNGERREFDKARIVVGRSRDCDVQLSDPNVSRRHAELRREETGVWIVDLGSTNGVELNGARVTRAQLSDGDVLLLGSTEIRFGLETA
jgi:hypothetical protein